MSKSKLELSSVNVNHIKDNMINPFLTRFEILAYLNLTQTIINPVRPIYNNNIHKLI